ncbi:MAG: M23 family metallopeptidase [Actinomycetota bacterium]|nr:M23 family metallopeptidase [Actinomycetota bacterium]
MGREALGAEATRLSRLVFLVEDQLDQLEVQALAAADLYRAAEADLAGANARAGHAQQVADRADRELRMAQGALESFARDTYINGPSELASSLLLLDSNGPADLIERANLLEEVAASRTEVLDRVVAAQERTAAAQEAATEALDINLEAEAQARTTLAQATAILEEKEATLPTLLTQKAEYETTFYAALVELLGPEGAAAAFAQYEQDLATQYDAEAAARAAANGGGPVLSGNWALPLAGRLTSCFCERWGSMHWGIDIAAPMYTPHYSAGDGVVVQAGSATGFGQAVYIEHDNGDVTVYGHMEVIEVVVGQRVAAGQEIALVGSQGFSTGPHLHFEVYVGGLNGVRVDPVLWLAERGIFI